ncbi:MAG: hypothetical protein IJY21_04875, partial [Clostridia bacterium]|nr:hypothetical protein [Clostridia bacterium]
MLTDAYNDFEGFEPSNYANFRATTSNSGAMYLINLVNNGSGSWTVTVNTSVFFDPKAAADGTDLGTQSQSSFTATVTGNSLSEIMSTFMQITDKETTVYVTEVRGVAKTTEA